MNIMELGAIGELVGGVWLKGARGHDNLLHWDAVVMTHLSFPGIAKWWETYRSIYARGVADYIDDRLQSLSSGSLGPTPVSQLHQAPRQEA